MAIFPQTYTHIIEACGEAGNTGERLVAEALQRCLSDDYCIWHNIPIIHGRAQQKKQHLQPDFIIFHPEMGILVLEVKHWKHSSIVGLNPDHVFLKWEGQETVRAVKNPIQQARHYAQHIRAFLERDVQLLQPTGLFKGMMTVPYAWGAILSNIRIQQASMDLLRIFNPPLTLFRDHLEMKPDILENALRSMFFTIPGLETRISAAQQDRVRWLLFPELRIHRNSPPPAQPAHPITAPDPGQVITQKTPRLRTTRQNHLLLPAADLKEDIHIEHFCVPDTLHVMDAQQERIARSLRGGHRVIHGVAGSGKTMILLFRAQYLAEIMAEKYEKQKQESPNLTPPPPILVLCYNKPLAQYLEYHIARRLRESALDTHWVEVRTFDAWCLQMARRYQLPTPPFSTGGQWFEQVKTIVTQAIIQKHIPNGQYSAVLLDEAHDFSAQWLQCVAQMVAPAENPKQQPLLILYDDAQAINRRLPRNFSFASVGIQAQGRTDILKHNYRNTAEILHFALLCTQEALHLDSNKRENLNNIEFAENPHLPCVRPITGGRRGTWPQLLHFADENAEAQGIAQHIAHLHFQKGIALSDIAILCGTGTFEGIKMMRCIAHALQQCGIAVQAYGLDKNHFQGIKSDTSKHSSVATLNFSRSAVRLLNMRVAKGLEFPHVFIAQLHAGVPGQHTAAEGLRLFYVAMTRSTHTLTLSYSGAVQNVQENINQNELTLVQRVMRALELKPIGDFSSSQKST